MKKSIKKSLVAKLAGVSIAASIFLGFATTNAQAATSTEEGYSTAYDKYTNNIGDRVSNKGSYMESLSLRNTLVSAVMSEDKASYEKTKEYISTEAESDYLTKQNQSNVYYIKSQVFYVVNKEKSISTNYSSIKVLNKIYDVATIKTNEKVMSESQFKTLMYHKNGWQTVSGALYDFVNNSKNSEETIVTINGRDITVAELKSIHYKANIEPRYTAKFKNSLNVMYAVGKFYMLLTEF